jgi:Fe(3+) dicitrate transport protein
LAQEAFYLNGSLRRQNQNVELTGNRLEGVPRLILRNGLQGRFKQWESLLLFSYTDKNYSDPFNNKEPSATGAAGIVPAYKVWDWNFGVKISNKCRLLLTINNLYYD